MTVAPSSRTTAAPGAAAADRPAGPTAAIRPSRISMAPAGPALAAIVTNDASSTTSSITRASRPEQYIRPAARAKRGSSQPASHHIGSSRQYPPAVMRRDRAIRASRAPAGIRLLLAPLAGAVVTIKELLIATASTRLSSSWHGRQRYTAHRQQQDQLTSTGRTEPPVRSR